MLGAVGGVRVRSRVRVRVRVGAVAGVRVKARAGARVVGSWALVRVGVRVGMRSDSGSQIVQHECETGLTSHTCESVNKQGTSRLSSHLSLGRWPESKSDQKREVLLLNLEITSILCEIARR